MRVLLITVAGQSSRFSASIGKPVLKCLFFINSIKESLLYQMMQRHHYFDKIIVVGGYKFNELKSEIEELFPELLSKIILVFNDQYETYGSGYSFYKGIQELRNIAYNELVFSEGDLFLDEKSFAYICETTNSVMTYGNSPVESKKSVAFYIDENDKPHYIYDTEHSLLKIDAPFKAIYNSGQVWKFADKELFDQTVMNLPEDAFKGTNLVPVNKYFQTIKKENVDYIGFKTWINCNTIQDFCNSLEE